MTIRTTAIFATVTLLGLATGNRASAQPVAPNRPPSNAFGNFFNPGAQVIPNAGVVNGINRAGAGGPGLGMGGLQGGLGQAYYGPFAPFILAQQPAVFNNRGHWYANYYGHWYPNGLTSGVGVLSNGLGASSRLGPINLGLGGSTNLPGAGAQQVPGVLGMPGGGAGPAPGGGAGGR
jgi:hypothetical protein